MERLEGSFTKIFKKEQAEEFAAFDLGIIRSSFWTVAIPPPGLEQHQPCEIDWQNDEMPEKTKGSFAGQVRGGIVGEPAAGAEPQPERDGADQAGRLGGVGLQDPEAAHYLHQELGGRPGQTPVTCSFVA